MAKPAAGRSKPAAGRSERSRDALRGSNAQIGDAPLQSAPVSISQMSPACRAARGCRRPTVAAADTCGPTSALHAGKIRLQKIVRIQFSPAVPCSLSISLVGRSDSGRTTIAIVAIAGGSAVEFLHQKSGFLADGNTRSCAHWRKSLNAAASAKSWYSLTRVRRTWWSR
jgi:hypothetical protein